MVKVSVVMITYNQEAFIEEAILGVLGQEINFEIELIVSDDCSVDNTESIVQQIIRSHPNGNFIKYTHHQSNLGMMPNFIWALQRCTGKYIALCEGDDYWIDSNKLQKQVDFLEANPDFVLVYHSVDVLFPDGHVEKNYLVSHFNKPESNIYDLATLGNFIHTPSAVFRNVIRNIPTQFSRSPIGDYFLWLLLAEHGSIKRIDEVMAVYRIGVGVFSKKSTKQRTIDFIKALSLIKDVISDQTVAAIIEQRIIVSKMTLLPKVIKIKENIDLSEINNANQFYSYVNFSELMRSILKAFLKNVKVSKRN